MGPRGPGSGARARRSRVEEHTEAADCPVLDAVGHFLPTPVLIWSKDGSDSLQALGRQPAPRKREPKPKSATWYCVPGIRVPEFGRMKLVPQ